MSKELYEGKYFYEVKDWKFAGKPCKLLIGPFDNIRYVSKINSKGHSINDYEFVQIVNGKPMVVYKENEILVTDRLL